MPTSITSKHVRCKVSYDKPQFPCYLRTMGLFEDIMTGLNRMKGISWKNQEDLAEKAGVNQSQVSRLFTGGSIPKLDAGCRILEAAGASIVFPDQQPTPRETSREVCFVHVDQVAVGNAQQYYPIASEDYVAAPLASMEVAAGPGLIPAEGIDGWVLVYKHEPSIRHRSDLAAFRVGRNETSMVKTIHPGEIVLVDRQDWRVVDPPGNIYLVREPEGALAVKRASLQRVSRREQITFYSDNEIFPPRSYDMAEYDNDLRRAIVGRIVWSWSDMTRR